MHIFKWGPLAICFDIEKHQLPRLAGSGSFNLSPLLFHFCVQFVVLRRGLAVVLLMGYLLIVLF